MGEFIYFQFKSNLLRRESERTLKPRKELTELRSTEEVIKDHLELARRDNWVIDLKRNFSEDCVLPTSFGVYRGHDGIREKIKLLHEHLPQATYSYEKILFHKEMGFLKWSGESTESYVDDGADSYLVRNGKIVVMTIHCTPKRKTKK